MGVMEELPKRTAGSSEVLNQTGKMPICPMRMAVGGFGAAAVIGYLVLYSKKKPEASAVNVAKVTSGTSKPANTHPPS